MRLDVRTKAAVNRVAHAHALSEGERRRLLAYFAGAQTSAEFDGLSPALRAAVDEVPKNTSYELAKKALVAHGWSVRERDRYLNPGRKGDEIYLYDETYLESTTFEGTFHHRICTISPHARHRRGKYRDVTQPMRKLPQYLESLRHEHDKRCGCEGVFPCADDGAGEQKYFSGAAK